MDASLFRCHDYKFLIQRWRKLARAAGLKLRPFAQQSSGHEVFIVTSPHEPVEDGIYLSAGIHGDEPASTEALFQWAQSRAADLQHVPLMILPCLNPWGLQNNSRVDQNGHDLNRTFQHDNVPHIQALKALLKPYRFGLSITLHEDYDGQGLYIYEVERHSPFWGEDLLNMARPLIPIEGRVMIDGRRTSKAGLVRRKLDIQKFPMIPEAIYLHLHHSQRTFTFETPSEFGLEQRVHVHAALVEECFRRWRGELQNFSQG